MNTKSLTIGLVVVVGVLAVLLGITYSRQRLLVQNINTLQSNAAKAQSAKQLRDALQIFFNDNTVISLLRSKASEFGGDFSSSTLSNLSRSSGAIGAQVTITGVNLTLPSYIIFGSGIIKDPITSQTADSLTFTVPRQVLSATCPPFADNVCAKIGGTGNGSLINITPGTYKISVVNTQGTISNELSFTVTQ